MSSRASALARVRQVLYWYLPVLTWAPVVGGDWHMALNDLIGGLVVGVMLIPTSLSWANLAQLPLSCGLTAGLIASFVYGTFGACPAVSMGAVAEITTLLVSITFIPVESREVVFQSIGLQVGILSILLSFVDGGMVIKTVFSKAVGDAYTCAAALLVIALQVKNMFNVKTPSETLFHNVIYVTLVALWDQVSYQSLGCFALFLTYTLYLIYIKTLPLPLWIPHQIIVVTVSTLLTWSLRLDESLGLDIVRDIPNTLSSPRFPPLHDVMTLGPYTLTVTILAFLQIYVIAQRIMPDINPNSELFACGMTNLLCNVFGGMPVSNSFGCSAVLLDRQVRTPLTSFMAGVVLLTTIFGLNSLHAFYYLPKNALAAVVTAGVVRLIDFGEPFKLLRYSRTDATVWAVTFFFTLFGGITKGVLSGIALSLVFVVLRVARPRAASLGFSWSESQELQDLMHDPELLVYPYVLFWRFDAPLYFVSLGYFETKLRRAIEQEVRPIDVVIVCCSKISDIDAAALAKLPQVISSIEKTLSAESSSSSMSAKFASLVHAELSLRQAAMATRGDSDGDGMDARGEPEGVGSHRVTGVGRGFGVPAAGSVVAGDEADAAEGGAPLPAAALFRSPPKKIIFADVHGRLKSVLLTAPHGMPIYSSDSRATTAPTAAGTVSAAGVAVPPLVTCFRPGERATDVVVGPVEDAVVRAARGAQRPQTTASPAAASKVARGVPTLEDARKGADEDEDLASLPQWRSADAAAAGLGRKVRSGTMVGSPTLKVGEVGGTNVDGEGDDRHDSGGGDDSDSDSEGDDAGLANSLSGDVSSLPDPFPLIYFNISDAIDMARQYIVAHRGPSVDTAPHPNVAFVTDAVVECVLAWEGGPMPLPDTTGKYQTAEMSWDSAGSLVTAPGSGVGTTRGSAPRTLFPSLANSISSATPAVLSLTPPEAAMPPRPAAAYVDQNPGVLVQGSASFGISEFLRKLQRQSHYTPNRQLVGVIGLVRHAERTPKQKRKLLFQNTELIDAAFGSSVLPTKSMGKAPPANTSPIATALVNTAPLTDAGAHDRRHLHDHCPGPVSPLQALREGKYPARDSPPGGRGATPSGGQAANLWEFTSFCKEEDNRFSMRKAAPAAGDPLHDISAQVIKRPLTPDDPFFTTVERLLPKLSLEEAAAWRNVLSIISSNPKGLLVQLRTVQIVEEEQPRLPQNLADRSGMRSRSKSVIGRSHAGDSSTRPTSTPREVAQRAASDDDVSGSRRGSLLHGIGAVTTSCRTSPVRRKLPAVQEQRVGASDTLTPLGRQHGRITPGAALRGIGGVATRHRIIKAQIVVKWGGVLTKRGLAQAHALGHQLLARFFAAGDLPLERLIPFTQSTTATAANEPRDIITAATLMAAVTQNVGFSTSDVRLDDQLLAVISDAARNAISEESVFFEHLMHLNTIAETRQHFHITGFRQMVERPRRASRRLRLARGGSSVGTGAPVRDVSVTQSPGGRVGHMMSRRSRRRWDRRRRDFGVFAPTSTSESAATSVSASLGSPASPLAAGQTRPTLNFRTPYDVLDELNGFLSDIVDVDIPPSLSSYTLSSHEALGELRSRWASMLRSFRDSGECTTNPPTVVLSPPGKPTTTPVVAQSFLSESASLADSVLDAVDGSDQHLCNRTMVFSSALAKPLERRQTALPLLRVESPKVAEGGSGPVEVPATPPHLPSAVPHVQDSSPAEIQRFNVSNVGRMYDNAAYDMAYNVPRLERLIGRLKQFRRERHRRSKLMRSQLRSGIPGEVERGDRRRAVGLAMVPPALLSLLFPAPATRADEAGGLRTAESSPSSRAHVAIVALTRITTGIRMACRLLKRVAHVSSTNVEGRNSSRRFIIGSLITRDLLIRLYFDFFSFVKRDEEHAVRELLVDAQKLYIIGKMGLKGDAKWVMERGESVLGWRRWKRYVSKVCGRGDDGKGSESEAELADVHRLEIAVGDSPEAIRGVHSRSGSMVPPATDYNHWGVPSDDLFWGSSRNAGNDPFYNNTVVSRLLGMEGLHHTEWLQKLRDQYPFIALPKTKPDKRRRRQRRYLAYLMLRRQRASSSEGRQRCCGRHHRSFVHRDPRIGKGEEEEFWRFAEEVEQRVVHAIRGGSRLTHDDDFFEDLKLYVTMLLSDKRWTEGAPAFTAGVPEDGGLAPRPDPCLSLPFVGAAATGDRGGIDSGEFSLHDGRSGTHSSSSQLSQSRSHSGACSGSWCSADSRVTYSSDGDGATRCSNFSDVEDSRKKDRRRRRMRYTRFGVDQFVDDDDDELGYGNDDIQDDGDDDDKDTDDFLGSDDDDDDDDDADGGSGGGGGYRAGHSATLPEEGSERMRLYFTDITHVRSVSNVLFNSMVLNGFAQWQDDTDDGGARQFYMQHLVFKVFRKRNVNFSDDDGTTALRNVHLLFQSNMDYADQQRRLMEELRAIYHRKYSVTMEVFRSVGDGEQQQQQSTPPETASAPRSGIARDDGARGGRRRDNASKTGSGAATEDVFPPVGGNFSVAPMRRVHRGVSLEQMRQLLCEVLEAVDSQANRA